MAGLSDLLAGAPAEPVVPKKEAAPANDPPPVMDDPTIRAIYEREGNAWALDVFWVYEHLGSRMTRKEAGTAARWGLYQFAKKNTENFMGQVLPKAMVLLEKAREKAGDPDELIIEEKKGINELRRILTAAIAEAAGGD